MEVCAGAAFREGTPEGAAAGAAPGVSVVGMRAGLAAGDGAAAAWNVAAWIALSTGGEARDCMA